jgi:uncharacterized protein YkwD
MALGGRILRYLLELLAIGSVLLIPTGCDPAALTLPSQVADGPAGENDSPADDDGTDDDGQPDLPVDDGGNDPGSTDDGPGADDPADDDAGDPPADDGADDLPTDNPDDDDPPPNDPGDDDPPDDDPPSDPEVPSNAYCDPVADWPDEWRAFEEEVLALVNERRAGGADCHSQGTFAPAGPLEFDLALRCAARAHSMDMGVRDFFSHTNPDGDDPGDRMSYAGYSGFGWGENIAWGYPTSSDVVAGWMSSDGHCANIMRPQWTVIGVGYYEGNIWTQTFGGD